MQTVLNNIIRNYDMGNSTANFLETLLTDQMDPVEKPLKHKDNKKVNFFMILK